MKKLIVLSLLCVIVNSVHANLMVSSIDSFPDFDPPSPNPPTFAVAPVAISDTAVSMTATLGSDVSSPIEYYFNEMSGNPGGNDSGWQTSLNYIDVGLWPNTQYIYTVTMRDVFFNTTHPSAQKSVTTVIVPEPATLSLLALGGFLLRKRK